MGSIRTFGPVKLFTGVLVSDASFIKDVETRLSIEFGTVDLRSPAIPFNFTDYYRQETGDNIVRVFFAFEQLIDGQALASIKRRTNAIEEQFAASQDKVKRPVNLDPGYLENSKVVLASTKNFYHRLYLGNGIFAEVTMHFRNGAWEFFPWTYPDYQSRPYQDFFDELRKRYREQLRTLCIRKQEGS
jgi:hypothetical protein